MTDADIQKGLVGLEKLQIQNLKPLVTLLLFFLSIYGLVEVESNGLKSFLNSSSALVVLSSSILQQIPDWKTVIWHFQEERQTTALKMQNLVMPVFIYRYTELFLP